MSKLLTTEEFIRRSKLKQKVEYGYEKVNYINQYKEVIINCRKHGDFLQIPKSHMLGFGCSKCGDILNSKNKKGKSKPHKLNLEEIVNKSKKLFNYDYSDSYLMNNLTINNIKCEIHGYFNKRISNHLYQKQGCTICTSNKLDIDKFVNRSNLIHQNKYDYTKFEYVNNYTKSIIICDKHGYFLQTPSKHLDGQGCTICSNTSKSKGEEFITNFLISNNIDFESQKRIIGTKLKFDFYIPSKDIYIEYDGIQHFKPIDIFGGYDEFNKILDRDSRKNKYCFDNSLRLIRISYKEYSNLNDILENILNHE